MSAIVLLDTSVYLNVLDVPGFNQDRDKVFAELQDAIGSGDYFLLPLATVWERNCALHPMSRVRIWSLDSDLAGYDRQP